VSEVAPAEQLHGFPSVPPLIVQLLWNRQIRDSSSIAAFLDDSGPPAASPWTMQGVAEAVERVFRARQRGETVAIYGDYDVDGLTATALLVECLRIVDVEPVTHVPRRDRDGYGLNRAAIDRLQNDGVSLIVTVDCGISGAAEVEYARDLGIDVIVTDHHHAPPELPRAAAVLNPNQPGCTYPFKALSGVGVADRLARALLERAGLDPAIADQWLDLAAVGTVADVVSLTGENRTIVAKGIRLLNPPTRPGLAALAERAGLAGRRVSPGAIGFALAPRLNAVGRLDDAAIGLRLLLTSSLTEARELAADLDAANHERQQLTYHALALARVAIQQRSQESAQGLPRLLIVADQRYRLGIAGLVAAKLVEEYGRPALVAEIKDDQLRGSARSIDAFHITKALARCGDLLGRFGGHAMAAGFTIAADRFEEFRDRLEMIGEDEISDEALVPRVKVDAQITLRRYEQNLPDLIECLEPFGCDNPRPVFLSRRVRVLDRRIVGSDSPGHLKVKLADALTRWDAIAFRQGGRLAGLTDYIDVVYSVERDDWNGRSGAQLRVLDFAPSTRQS
jgi:single-stranded-DNA-specific exonuclease